jgi:hypothetical protein
MITRRAWSAWSAWTAAALLALGSVGVAAQAVLRAEVVAQRLDDYAALADVVLEGRTSLGVDESRTSRFLLTGDRRYDPGDLRAGGGARAAVGTVERGLREHPEIVAAGDGVLLGLTDPASPRTAYEAWRDVAVPSVARVRAGTGSGPGALAAFTPLREPQAVFAAVEVALRRASAAEQRALHSAARRLGGAVTVVALLAAGLAVGLARSRGARVR